MRKFDARFAAVAEALPPAPGVYRFFDESGRLIYVGKAKNLRRRLAQYRNAKRIKAHAKMRKIIHHARKLEYETCASEHAALELETRLIQEHRPKWNVAGAFSFLYPLVGIRVIGHDLYLCCTTQPDLYPGFSFHGAFRSRFITRDSFFSLTSLLRILGHSYSLPELRKQGFPRNSYKGGYVYGFRQIPADWHPRLEAFFRGEDFAAIEELSLLLLDRPTALKKRAETEEQLKSLKRFWLHEAKPLRRARAHSRFQPYPVPQKQRDLLFIALRFDPPSVADPRSIRFPVEL
jgi:predicted GIY-YIG superfamily endonuclease